MILSKNGIISVYITQKKYFFVEKIYKVYNEIKNKNRILTISWKIGKIILTGLSNYDIIPLLEFLPYLIGDLWSSYKIKSYLWNNMP